MGTSRPLGYRKKNNNPRSAYTSRVWVIILLYKNSSIHSLFNLIPCLKSILGSQFNSCFTLSIFKMIFERSLVLFVTDKIHFSFCYFL